MLGKKPTINKSKESFLAKMILVLVCISCHLLLFIFGGDVNEQKYGI